MKRILVIDDEDSVRAAVRITLQGEGYKILEAANGEDGLERARSELPDLVLSDFKMGAMNGLMVLQNLRSDPRTATIPLILMTALPEQADVRGSMELGADDYLAKPFGTKVLIAAVAARLDRQRAIAAQARENEARLRELLSATHDLIAIADSKSELLLYLNRAGRQMLGLTSEEDITTLRLSAFMSSGPLLEERLNAARRNGAWLGETIWTARDGRSIPVSEQILAHNGAPDRAACFSIVARDISERKRAEAELERTHRELLRASRQAGMAEIASEMLHNVGNALNSVNVASACIGQTLKKSKASTLARVVSLLREHEIDLGSFLMRDPKGRQIPGFLAQLSERLIREQESAGRELAELQNNIEHIVRIVTMHQSYAGPPGTEVVELGDLVEDSLKMTAGFVFHGGIAIQKNLREDVTLRVDKPRVLQILVNLVRNAKEACEAGGAEQKQVRISAVRVAGRVRIEVSDNGIGIRPEHLERIFAQGFTTKKNGHGLSLHSSASTAKELGGILSVHSTGPGHGATFTLELPLGTAAKASRARR